MCTWGGENSFSLSSTPSGTRVWGRNFSPPSSSPPTCTRACVRGRMISSPFLLPLSFSLLTPSTSVHAHVRGGNGFPVISLPSLSLLDLFSPSREKREKREDRGREIRYEKGERIGELKLLLLLLAKFDWGEWVDRKILRREKIRSMVQIAPN